MAPSAACLRVLLASTGGEAAEAKTGVVVVVSQMMTV
jgi:hypothetical protein